MHGLTTGLRETALVAHRRSQAVLIDALTMVLGYRQPQGALLHHSDRGPQHTSDGFRDVLKQNGIECSMSARSHNYLGYLSPVRHGNRTMRI